MYIRYEVTDKDDGSGAEQVLRRRLRFSGSLCKRMKRYAALHCNGKFILNADKVKNGDVLEVDFVTEDEWVGSLPNPNNILIPYEDAWFALVSKPANLPTHPRFPGDPGLTTRFEPANVHPVNRLDLDTSGLSILAKNPYAQDLLSQTPICKMYLALVHGKMQGNGVIAAPIDRAPDSIILREVAATGKMAVSHYASVAYWAKADVSLLAFRLETGRTHQIRVHCQHAGFPIVGDTLYGWEQTFRTISEIRGRSRANFLMEDKRDYNDPALARDFLAMDLNKRLQRQFLHAFRLIFEHPIEGGRVAARAVLPEDLLAVLRYINAKERSISGGGSVRALLDLQLKANNIQGKWGAQLQED